ncbi:MAG: hypothetical protein JJT94_06430 [Bernardetiaceae bacterium]|nr:hypothetical protein [Bernardetiaceae bacterium]
MSFADKILNRLFPKKEESTTSRIPVYTEALKRNEKYQEAYIKWREEADTAVLLATISRAYEAKFNKMPSIGLEVHLLQTPYSNGIAITYHPEKIGTTAFPFLFDLCKDKILEGQQPYLLYTSDKRVYERKNYIETIEKHYLKPSFKENTQEDKLFEQRYGNILIEAIYIDDKPSFIRLMANIYSDHKFEKPLPFKELLHLICH